jgi:ubiquinone/menaquinone biosynthesis C-methylase UbiE
MMTSNEYFISTGEKDAQRLTIVNQLYNPGSVSFLKHAGLKPGMKVLEIGCGAGHMACEIAQVVTSSGTVVASDLHHDQLNIAKATAQRARIDHIQFIHLDLNESLNDYHEEFDFIFGRWVLEFTYNPQQTLSNLFACLRQNGTLVYEGTDIRDPGCFSYPYAPVIEQYCQYGIQICELNQMELDFIKKSYFHLKKCGASACQTAINHPMMHTPIEKMPFRLVFESSKSFLFKHNLLSHQQYNCLIQNLIEFECTDNIAGYYRNLIVAGTKTEPRPSGSV